jgi:hypothetical protein
LGNKIVFFRYLADTKNDYMQTRMTWDRIHIPEVPRLSRALLHIVAASGGVNYAEAFEVVMRRD